MATNKDKLPKAYEASKYEDDIYQYWESSGLFNPDECINKGVTSKDAPTFTIVLPPPNVTGKLHLGHASMLAYEDLIIRFQRLQGKQTLWVPGTDHAAIATQTVVEKELAKEGLKKEDLGREKFLQRVREYVSQSKDTIRRQLRKMGASLDWSREKYTLDEDVSRIVYHVFTRMYEDGLIYRGDRIVNWCPRCHSTLADDEVEYKEQKAKLYYIKYGPVVIATTRPETKIGDTGLAVHPDDQRYQDLIGKELEINLGKVDIKVKVFADKEVDPEFGSGAIGVTPAHSQTDFAWAEKYDLAIKKIIDEDGKMTAAAGPYAGLSVSECRERFIADLKEAGLLVKVEEIENNISVCYRCDTPIEPLTSKQWFIDVNKKIPRFGKSLKELSIEAVRQGLGGDPQQKIDIIPERFYKTYFQWMENLRDWCISRQIWWGHRIPVWYRQGEEGQEVYVGVEPPEGEGWRQDEDTLDTWFSSALWTFSTLGWPDGDDFKRFHPTQVLETGYDILFFWVARMIIMTIYTTSQIPFEKVYLHGLIRDKQGRKMSKSLGNGIDPLEMIEKYGADALRLSMIIGTAPGNDIRMYEEKIAGYRNFVNKFWNIARFILLTVKQPERIANQPTPKTLADQWILANFNQLIQEVTGLLEQFSFSPAAEKLYEFTWSKLADWYLEVAKIEQGKDEILNYILERLLIMLHPFVPFVTEVIWSASYNPEKKPELMLMVQKWPQAQGETTGGEQFDLLQEIIVNIRSLRSTNKIPPVEIVDVKIESEKYQQLIREQKELIAKLARVGLVDELDKNSALHYPGDDYDIYLAVSGDIKARLEKEKKELEKYIASLEKKLNNEEFLRKAPAAVVDKEKEKLRQAKEKLSKLG